MPRRPTQSQARLFAQLIAELEPTIQRGFMASVTDLTANVNWPRLLTELERSNIEGAIAALNISPAAWAEYSSAMTAAYAKAGASTAAQIVQSGVGPIGVRFNMANPRAEAWIRQNVAERVVGFAEEQIRVARAVIESGYAQGQGPRTIAVDLVGRATGPGRTRVGGVLGLDGPRAERLQIVAQGMRTPEGVRGLVVRHESGALSIRYKVNTATERRILKAYRAGTAVPEAERIISERQYSNALLKARGDTVARTETATAVMSARDEEWRQLAESQGLSGGYVVKTWRHRGGPTAHHRPDHLAMAGTSVRGLDTPFIFPDGAMLQYASDPNGGAAHVINCRCSTEYRMDQTAGLE